MGDRYSSLYYDRNVCQYAMSYGLFTVYYVLNDECISYHYEVYAGAQMIEGYYPEDRWSLDEAVIDSRRTMKKLLTDIKMLCASIDNLDLEDVKKKSESYRG